MFASVLTSHVICLRVRTEDGAGGKRWIRINKTIKVINVTFKTPKLNLSTSAHTDE